VVVTLAGGTLLEHHYKPVDHPSLPERWERFVGIHCGVRILKTPRDEVRGGAVP
jgi:hypothetical protein